MSSSYAVRMWAICTADIAERSQCLQQIRDVASRPCVCTDIHYCKRCIVLERLNRRNSKLLAEIVDVQSEK